MKSVSQAIAASVVSGTSVWLFRPADWPRWTRWGYVMAPSVVAMAGTGLMTGLVGASQDSHPEASETDSSDEDTTKQEWLLSFQSAPIRSRWLAVIGAGIAVSVIQVSSLAVDGAVECWLTRRGSRRPRRVMGAAFAVLTLLELAFNAKNANTSDRD